MITSIREAGGTVVEVDTDGIFFVPPEGVDDEEKETRFITSIAGHMPRGISVALDGRYRKMLSYKKKNYALLTYDEELRIRGSSLTSRSMERFGREYIRECIACLLRNDIAGLHGVYVRTRDRVSLRQLDVRDFARVESLSDTLADYRKSVDAGKRTRSAAYEVAFRMDKPLRRGDRVAYYLAGDDPNPKGFESGKPVTEWDPNFPDQNVPYYLRRLDEFSEKFRPFFSSVDYRRIFSPDDLFPFSPEGITILVPEIRELQPPEGDASADEP
jgi:DNA polymerase elongation subunit (family B)